MTTSAPARPTILLLGRDGQLGSELRRALSTLGSVAALGREQADLSDAESLRRTVRAHRPALIVNAAAYNAVDAAEREPAVAMAVNGAGPGVLAEEADALGAVLVHYSSDFVFGVAREGAGGQPRPLLESDVPEPLGAYARSKLAGENAVRAAGCRHLIFRTSWVFSPKGRTFLAALLRREYPSSDLRVVDDEFSAPTWAPALADATGQILAATWARDGSAAVAEYGGTYHLAGGGGASRYTFAEAVLAAFAARGEPVPRLRPIASAAFPTTAPRPRYSVLDCGRARTTFGVALPDWRESLTLCLGGDR